jgi:hypothetical protein
MNAISFAVVQQRVVRTRRIVRHTITARQAVTARLRRIVLRLRVARGEGVSGDMESGSIHVLVLAWVSLDSMWLCWYRCTLVSE